VAFSTAQEPVEVDPNAAAEKLPPAKGATDAGGAVVKYVLMYAMSAATTVLLLGCGYTAPMKVATTEPPAAHV